MPGCEHKRTEFMMRRDGVDYLRCLDCDQVFEAEDLEQIPADDLEEEEPPRAASPAPHRDRKEAGPTVA
jgi:hypothetical protein